MRLDHQNADRFHCICKAIWRSCWIAVRVLRTVTKLKKTALTP